MRRAFLLLAFLWAATLAGCGPSYPKLPKLGPNAVVLAFGDSLTFGTGASAPEAYPVQLERMIGRKVVAAGVPGEISAEGLERLPRAIEESSPALLVLCHGGNDFLRKMGDDGAAANVRAMARLAQEKGIAVMIVATPKPGFGVSKVKFYEDIGRELAIPVETEVLLDVLGSGKLKSDLVHPNAEGYRRIAEAVAKVLKKSGAL
jgi:lysophospholipase L1-like esterase